MQCLMFPEGCGYRSETGGLMECLRELGVEQSKRFGPRHIRHPTTAQPLNLQYLLCSIHRSPWLPPFLLSARQPLPRDHWQGRPHTPATRPRACRGEYPAQRSSAARPPPMGHLPSATTVDAISGGGGRVPRRRREYGRGDAGVDGAEGSGGLRVKY